MDVEDRRDVGSNEAQRLATIRELRDHRLELEAGSPDRAADGQVGCDDLVRENDVEDGADLLPPAYFVTFGVRHLVAQVMIPFSSARVPNVRLIVTMTDDDDWPGERRRIDADFFKDQLGENLNAATYMVAGPPGMAKAITAELQLAGVAQELIATDSFSGY